MYNCAIKFHFADIPPQMAEEIMKIAPLPGFRHEFACALEDADVILAGPALDDRQIESLLDAKKEDAQVYVLRHDLPPLPDAVLARLADMWIVPPDSGLLAFHFSRLQQNYRQKIELWQTNQFMESMLSTTPNLVWFKDKDGVHEIVSESFCRTVKKSRQDVQGRKHAYIWNVEKDDPACIESERVVMDTRRVHVAGESIETGQGKRMLTTYKAPLFNVDGSVMGTMGIGLDITQELAYREQLERNNAALENIFTTMDCGILFHSLDGERVISVNAAALKLLGYDSIDDLQNGNFHLVAASVLEEDKPRLRAAIHSLKQPGDSTNYEYRIKHLNGKTFHVMGNAKLVEKDGEIVCQRFLLDCTAQKQEEERERREQEKRQMELVRALSVDYQLVFVLDGANRDNKILQLLDHPDQKLAKIFAGGGSLAQKLKTYAETCVFPEDREAFLAQCSFDALQDVLSEKMMHYFNYRVWNGSDIQYFQLKAVRTRIRHQGWDVVLGIQSINARIRTEIEQKNQLAQALKQAQKASNAKSIFLSNMSHDIRTPMNAIVGYAALAMANHENWPQVEDYLKKILTSGKHLISLINDILDMSHIESGKVKLENNLHSLPAMLKELWNIIQPTAKAKKQTLTFDIDDVLNEEIYCDKLRLNQILLNLLSNAVKYTGVGGDIKLTVRQSYCAQPERASYEFRVQDNGIGMSDEFVAHIFEPFERAASTTIAGIQGTGLGMTITKNIVAMMKGTIDVNTKPNQGTEFIVRLTFSLPKQEIEAQSVENASQPRQDQAKEDRSARILLAEDNAMNQEIATEFLASAGYEVDVANNGQEAVDMHAQAGPGHYDVILMDVQMPVLDGYGATTKIRALSDARLASVPIIAMTANSFEEDRKEALAHGMNGHIPKPIDFGELFKTLDKILMRTDA